MALGRADRGVVVERAERDDDDLRRVGEGANSRSASRPRASSKSLAATTAFAENALPCALRQREQWQYSARPVGPEIE